MQQDGRPERRRRARHAPRVPRRRRRPQEERTVSRQFLREVRAELRKVVWPTRARSRNYSIIVLITVVVFTA